MPGSRWTVGLLLLMLTISSQAAVSRPDTGDGEPTEIQVSGAILDVDKIDSAEQNFTLNFYVMFRWTDLRLAHDQEGHVVRKLSEIWNPRLTITNTQRFWANTKDEVEISPDGLVTYRLHVFGDFSQPLDLHDFPHDSHVLKIPIVAAGYREGEIEFSPMPGSDSFIAEN